MTVRRRLPPDPLSPSEFVSRRSTGSVQVAGRVLFVRGREVVIADAMRTVTARLEPGADLPEPGALVILAAVSSRGKLARARVLARHPGTLGSAGSEFARFGTDGVARNLERRAVALRTVRAYFEEQRFVEVETPVRVPSPGLDAHVDAVRADGGFLVTSPELHMKRLVVGGLPRVFQIARVTRAGEEGALHEPEFTMVEWYRAFSGMDAVVRDTEALVLRVVRALSGKDSVRAPSGKRIELRAPFPRLTVRDAFRKHARVTDAVELAATDPDRYFRTFVEEVEPAIARSLRPVLLVEFPATEAALARRCPHDPSVAERFELYVGGVELCNGFGELTDPVEQRARFVREQERRKKTGAPLHPIDERFLAALEEGLPPSGGNALGLDRLIALALGEPRIDRTIAFPWAAR